MRTFTSEELQARFEELPPEVQEAVTSSEVQAKIKGISEKHSLHIDQFGALVDEIGLVMLGFQRSSMFITDLITRLEIPQKDAASIAQDVNTEIFSAIRKHLQEIDAKAEEDELHETTIPHMEQAGDMEILTDIKHPETPDVAPAKPEVKTPVSAPIRPYVEPLIDRLLSGSSGQTAQKIEVVAPAASIAPASQPTKPAPVETPSDKPKIDPYRETF